MLFVALSGQFVTLGGQLDKVVMEYRYAYGLIMNPQLLSMKVDNIHITYNIRVLEYK